MNAMRGKGDAACLADGRSLERTTARAYVEAAPVLAPARAAERQPRPGEALEPVGRI